MKQFYGSGRKSAYFEGWYHKHQNERHTIAFIPAFHMDHKGKASASIQVITNDGAHCFPFSMQTFEAQKKRYHIRIGENTFMEQGLEVKLQSPSFSVSGKLQYEKLTPLASDIMGPFSHIPFLQCRHGILSLTHSVSGVLLVNVEKEIFNPGVGFLEKDRGTSFPNAYLWTQCNWQDGSPCSVILSVAEIPFLGGRFTGCICTIYYGGREYRLATYLGAKIIRYEAKGVTLQQGNFRLEADLLEERPHPLQAPDRGAMIRTIHESIACKVRYQFFVWNKMLFDITGNQASYEFSKQN